MLAGFNQVGRHGAAHVAETDESNVRHVRLLFDCRHVPVRIFRGRSRFSVGA
jgi:hypothetical protein